MSNLKFLFNTVFDGAALDTAAGGADIDSAWPLENLQDTTRRKVCKTTGTGNVTFKIDLGESRFCSGLGFVEFNLEADTVVTVKAYSDAWSTEILSEEFEAIGPIVSLGEVPLGSYSLGGYPTDDDLVLYPKLTSAFWFGRTYARYWSVAVANGSGVPGEFYLGRMLLGDYWEVQTNPAWGLEYGLVDSSKTDVSLGGVKWSDRRDPHYRVSFQLGWLRDSELFGQFIRLAHHCGTSKDFLIQIMDEDNKKARFTTIYGRLLNDLIAAMQAKNINQAHFEFEESL